MNKELTQQARIIRQVLVSHAWQLLGVGGKVSQENAYNGIFDLERFNKLSKFCVYGAISWHHLRKFLLPYTNRNYSPDELIKAKQEIQNYILKYDDEKESGKTTKQG